MFHQIRFNNFGTCILSFSYVLGHLESRNNLLANNISETTSQTILPNSPCFTVLQFYVKSNNLRFLKFHFSLVRSYNRIVPVLNNSDDGF